MTIFRIESAWQASIYMEKSEFGMFTGVCMSLMNI